MANHPPIGTPDVGATWLSDPIHRDWLRRDAQRQLDFFRPSLRADGAFDSLDLEGAPIAGAPQELHATTRMVHSYVLGKALGRADADAMIDAGMAFLWNRHRDTEHGGYLWAVNDTGIVDGTKLAYGQVFVLLAASSARLAGHPDADRLLTDVAEVLDRHYWDEDHGLLRDEFARDWQPFSAYRGMNANMHGVEAHLAAFEATGDRLWLDRAGRILDFFVTRMAAGNDWRVPEHYTEDWQVDPDYAGNPMFRPAGTTPGHSLELGRLTLQHWDLAGRPDDGAPDRARHLVERALADGWGRNGGIAYTLDHSGAVAIPDRYWWPVAEAIGAVAALIKAQPTPGDEAWYRRLWGFADGAFIDHARGGWYPEIDPEGKPTGRQFHGKPDIYHSLQAALYPSLSGLSRHVEELAQAG